MATDVDLGIDTQFRQSELAGGQSTEAEFARSSNRLATEGVTKSGFAARALYVGEHIDLRRLLKSMRVGAQQPATITLEDGGIAVLYRYGAVVFFDTTAPAEANFLDDLVPLVSHVYVRPETEEVLIGIGSQDREGVEGGTVVLKDGSSERLQVVASTLGKSVALAQYESDVAANFDQIEPFAKQLERAGRGGRNMRQLLRHIGRALLNEHKMVARVEIIDRPGNRIINLRPSR